MVLLLHLMYFLGDILKGPSQLAFRLSDRSELTILEAVVNDVGWGWRWEGVRVEERLYFSEWIACHWVPLPKPNLLEGFTYYPVVCLTGVFIPGKNCLHLFCMHFYVNLYYFALYVFCMSDFFLLQLSKPPHNNLIFQDYCHQSTFFVHSIF